MTVINGQVNAVQNGKNLTLSTSDKSVLNWQSFSIGAQNGVVFQQPSASSQVLNRVVGQDPSSILGSLQSNGKVWLLNPNGVLFGKDARIDVGGLVASSLHLDTADFLASRYLLKTTAGGSGAVVNQGQITTPYGGQVMLVGTDVQNTGSITTPGGHTGLLAGSLVELTDTATPFMSVRVPVKAGQVLQSGSVSAERIDIHGAVVNQTGTLTATSMTQDASGQIVLRASGNAALTGGSTTQAIGGHIEVTSEGGALQVDGVVSTNAASAQGNGGSITLWGERALGVSAQVSARGGAQGGNGGIIETSTHGSLDIRSVPDASAPYGRAGTWLIDPNNVIIQATGVDTNITGNPNFVTSADTAIITTGSIQTALNAGTNVTITTGTGGANTQAGDITVASAITVAPSANAKLTLRDR
jgi:filamentous hemagglutinin family protein